MNAARSIIDRLSDAIGVPKRTIQDVAIRLRGDPTLAQHRRPGRHPAGEHALSGHEALNVILAIAARPAPGRRGLNAIETVRAVRSAKRFVEWDHGRPETAADFFAGTSFDPSVPTLGAALDSMIADLIAGTWPDRLASRLRFDHGGGNILLVIENWPTRHKVLADGEAPSPAARSEFAAVFHARELLDAWTPSCIETSIFLSDLAFREIASVLRPPPT